MANLRGQAPTWTPAGDSAHLAVENFRRFVGSRQGIAHSSYDELHAWSIQSPNQFWMLLWEFADIKSAPGSTKGSSLHAVDETLPMDTFPEFFRGANLNFAENVLDRGRKGIALKEFSEADGEGQFRSVSWDQLRQRVRITADALHGSRVLKGDVIAYVGSNTADAVVMLLATAAIGAIFTSLAGDMGESATLDRLRQINPKILFTVDSYQYNGKWYDCMERAMRVNQALSIYNSSKTFEMVVISTSYKARRTPQQLGQGMTYASFLQRACPRETEFMQLPFGHPLFILFSSGTTGAPKGLLHGHGGVTLNLKTEHLLYQNLGTEDVYYHYSNIGWTMWNIFLGGLLTGTTLVLYDGSPFYPTPARHIKHAVSLGTTVYGASPRYYSELKDRGIRPSLLRGINQIRLLGSTGAVLSAAVWQWMASEFGNRPIVSFSGGTEVCGSLIHGSLIHPQHAGEITVKKLGFDVDIFDEDGKTCPPGSAGELVVKTPFPSAAVRLWNDFENQKYHAAYYESFPGVWAHGDYAKINPTTGGILMLGRSDGILNPSGIRFGSSEIYCVIDKFPNLIKDSLCVGRSTPAMEEEVILFVQTRDGIDLTKKVEQRLRDAISAALSPRHVPKRFISVSNIPYNVNGKKMEVAVKRVLSGGAINDRMRATLVDPQSLDEFERHSLLALNRARL